MPLRTMARAAYLVLIKRGVRMFEYARGILHRIWQSSEQITELEFYEKELNKWIASPARLMQIKGSEYYKGKHEILRKKRTAIGRDGEPTEIKNLPNNKIVDNRYAIAVDQKVNYFMGKPFTVMSDDKKYSSLLNDIFDKSLRRTLKSLMRESINGGLAWLYAYRQDRELKFKVIPAYEILPFWADNEHTELDCALRYYRILSYEGKKTRVKEKVELYRRDGVYLYELDGGKLREDIGEGETSNKHPYVTGIGAVSWNRIPLIAFKYSSAEQPLIARVKSLQDGLNTLLSDFADNMNENVRNTILVIKNYDGEDLGQFRQNLATYGAVKVKTVDGSQGAVETLNIEVNADNYKTIIDIFRKTIIENAKVFDGKDERLNGSPNQMNIQSMYADIDLDTNEVETEFQAAIDELLDLMDIYFADEGKGSYFDTPASIVFNRNMLINESEAIDNCLKSAGMLSQRTILSKNPWVSDVDEELERLKEQEKDIYNESLGGEDNAE